MFILIRFILILIIIFMFRNELRLFTYIIRFVSLKGSLQNELGGLRLTLYRGGGVVGEGGGSLVRVTNRYSPKDVKRHTEH